LRGRPVMGHDRRERSGKLLIKPSQVGRVGAGAHLVGQILGKAPRRNERPGDSRVTTRRSTSTHPVSRPQASHLRDLQPIQHPPSRSSTGPPKNRVVVTTVTNNPSMTAPPVLSRCNPSTLAIASQSLPASLTNANPNRP